MPVEIDEKAWLLKFGMKECYVKILRYEANLDIIDLIKHSQNCQSSNEILPISPANSSTKADFIDLIKNSQNYQSSNAILSMSPANNSTKEYIIDLIKNDLINKSINNTSSNEIYEMSLVNTSLKPIVENFSNDKKDLPNTSGLNISVPTGLKDLKNTLELNSSVSTGPKDLTNSVSQNLQRSHEKSELELPSKFLRLESGLDNSEKPFNLYGDLNFSNLENANSEEICAFDILRLRPTIFPDDILMDENKNQSKPNDTIIRRLEDICERF